jgi:hypothetical protein
MYDDDNYDPDFGSDNDDMGQDEEFDRWDREDDVDEIQENEDFAHDNIIEDQFLDGMYEE